MRMCHLCPRRMEQVFVLHALWPCVQQVHNLMRIAYRSLRTYAHLPGLRTRAQIGYPQHFPLHAMSYKTPATVEQIF